MKIEYTAVRELRPYSNNARTHSSKQVGQIANSIKKFGFCNPVLIDDTNQIIAGHGRVEAAKLLGIETVPTCRLSHLSDADKRAYVLADNKLAEKAGWDQSCWRLNSGADRDRRRHRIDRVRDGGDRPHPRGGSRGDRRPERAGR